VVYGRRAWIPLIVLALVALLLTRSRRPLIRLIQGVWNDWTRLSFALYGFALPVFTVIFFDNEWGTFELIGLMLDTLLLAVGAIAFMRSRVIWQRVVSLQAIMWILVFKGILSGWAFPWRRALEEPAVLLLFVLLYGGLMFIPGLVGLLHRGVGFFSTR
jgi:hypothetical protein